MEVNPLLAGGVSLFTGFSGSDRILVGDYLGGAFKGLLFIGTAASLIYWPSSGSLASKASSVQITNFLMLILGIWYIYDVFTLFLKMSAPTEINQVYGRPVVWKSSNRARYVTGALFLFLFVSLFLLG